ncbi:ras GTPase-activating protein 3 isoform 1 [Camelus ferus]|nr:ras GTPase-activating protein 3 isoform 1 [Camelus ferus]
MQPPSRARCVVQGEAKNLPTYPGPNKMRDCYCTVNLDQEEVFRTKIVEKSLCPFYGEDFYCEIPRSFRHLSFYVFDRDVFRRDSIIGKVAIRKEDLPKYHNRDTWFQLQHVDADSEVQPELPGAQARAARSPGQSLESWDRAGTELREASGTAVPLGGGAEPRGDWEVPARPRGYQPEDLLWAGVRASHSAMGEGTARKDSMLPCPQPGAQESAVLSAQSAPEEASSGIRVIREPGLATHISAHVSVMGVVSVCEGKVHLELRLSEVITDSGIVCHKLATRILECQGLPIVNGQCDPYATVTLAGPYRQVWPGEGVGTGGGAGAAISPSGSPGEGVEGGPEAEVKSRLCPWTVPSQPGHKTPAEWVPRGRVTRPCSYSRKSHFDFEEEDVDKLEIRVDLWNASNLKFGDEFLGELRIPLKVLRQCSPYEAWYFLQPRDNGSKSLKPGDLGSLRLNVVYTEDHVFSSDYYGPLRDLLLRSADVEFDRDPKVMSPLLAGPGAGRGGAGEAQAQQAHPEHPVSASAAHILGEVCREKQEAAVPLVRLLLHYGRVVPFICAIASAEVRRTQDPNTIFRGNSLTSKCIDETMKLAGMQYLHDTLKPTIEEICQSHKSCEIDPVRLKEHESLESNMENLRQYVDRIFNVITKSGVSCPTVMCDIFFSLREAAAKRFQDDLDVRYTAVSSFIFLRFFAPAILSPNLFQLTPHHTDPQTSRTLTLVSKTIQTLGSLSKSKSVSH